MSVHRLDWPRLESLLTRSSRSALVRVAAVLLRDVRGFVVGIHDNRGLGPRTENSRHVNFQGLENVPLFN